MITRRRFAPRNVLELATESDYQGLTTTDPRVLREWFIADSPVVIWFVTSKVSITPPR